MGICKVEKCESRAVSKGMCPKHYARFKKYGDPLFSKYYRSHKEALAVRVESSGSCRIWTGHIDTQGYGRIKYKGKMWLAHRLAWTEEKGEIPEAMEIDHTCHNRACIAIGHLRLATRRQQMANLAGAQKNNKSTGVRNVYPARNGRFRVVVSRKEYGSYATLDEARKVAETKRAEVFGEFAGRG